MVTMDIDQAFEACQSSTVLPAWATISAAYNRRHGGIPIQVKRGRRNILRHGTKGFSRQWWSVGSGAIVRALLAATTLTLVVLAGMVLEMTGLSIGGVMSSAAVSVRLAAEESEFVSDSGHEKHMDWLRYVDDMLSMSFVMCCGCQVRVLQKVFQEKLSVVHRTDEAAVGTFFEWVDMHITVFASGVVWTIKNPNRDWLFFLHRCHAKRQTLFLGRVHCPHRSPRQERFYLEGCQDLSSWSCPMNC